MMMRIINWSINELTGLFNKKGVNFDLWEVDRGRVRNLGPEVSSYIVMVKLNGRWEGVKTED